MKTRIPPGLVSPNIITSVVRSGSNLHFTFGDGTSKDLDVLTIGQAVLATATADVNDQLATATANFALINPTPVVEGSIKTVGLSGFVFNDTWIKVTT